MAKIIDIDFAMTKVTQPWGKTVPVSESVLLPEQQNLEVPGSLLTPIDELELPAVWDNTRLDAFQTCPRKGEYSILRNLRPKKAARALDYGAAWHKFLEIWYKSDLFAWDQAEMETKLAEAVGTIVPPELHPLLETPYTIDDVRRELALAMALPVLPPLTLFQTGDPRTHTLLHNMAHTYTTIYPKEHFTVLQVEARFAFALPSGHTYYGILDTIIRDEMDKIKSMEHKTTSHLHGMEHEFNPRQQITGQIQGLQTLVKNASYEAIINAAMVPKRESQKSNPGDFVRFPNISRSLDQLEEFERNASVTIADIEAQYKAGFFRMNTSACNNYGGCPFRDICKKSLGAERQLEAENNYIIKEWDPTRGQAPPRDTRNHPV